jgi:hypothetical protein
MRIFGVQPLTRKIIAACIPEFVLKSRNKAFQFNHGQKRVAINHAVK